jgi:L-ascorbate metabolism protein UlaG (beta-lactamase superfamily)
LPASERWAKSDHCDGRRFFNPGAPAAHGLLQVARWALTRRKKPWPKWVEDPPQPGPPPAVAGDDLAATFVNHSTFLLQTQGVAVLTDPIWSERASPFTWAGPKRVRRPGVAFERLPPVGLVLVSHNHYDHLDLPTLLRLQEAFRPQFVTSLGNRRFLTGHGLERVEELDWWQSFRFNADVEVTLTPAQHFSARGLFDRNHTLWGGFLIVSGTRKVFFASDSAYPGHFKDVRERSGPLDLALLPFGAYEPRWFMGASHVNPEEAVRAHLDLGGPLTVGMHFGTFQLTDEPIDEPVQQLREALLRHGVPEGRFRVPAYGETILVPWPGPAEGT